VSVFDWGIPVRTDLQRGALDLIRSGRTRSSRTGSISVLLWTVRSRSNGGKQIGSPRVSREVNSGEVAAQESTAALLRWSATAM
jgi:hypothetical protein